MVSTRAMERKPDNRVEQLNTYEQDVWIFLALIGVGMVGLILWLAYLLLSQQ